MRHKKFRYLGQPPADPGPPAVKPQRQQSPRRHQIVDLVSGRAALVGRADVIVDHHPATVREPVAVAVDVAADIRIRIENEEADLARRRSFLGPP